MTLIAYKTSNAPAAIGPYSQMVRCQDFFYLSGQIGMDPKTGELVEGGLEAEVTQIFENIKSVLAEAKLDFQSIVKTTIFLRDMADFPIVNEQYQTYFCDPFPARSTIAVAGLPKNASIEIEVIAHL